MKYGLLKKYILFAAHRTLNNLVWLFLSLQQTVFEPFIHQ